MTFQDTNPITTGAKFTRNKILCNPYMGGDQSFLCPKHENSITACMMLVLFALISTVAFTYAGNLIKYSKKAQGKDPDKDKGPTGMIVGSSFAGAVVLLAVGLGLTKGAKAANLTLAMGLPIAAVAGVSTHVFVNADGNGAAVGAGSIGIAGTVAGLIFGYFADPAIQTENILAGGVVGGALGAAIGASFGMEDDIKNPDKTPQTKAFGATWNKVFGAKHMTYYLIAMLSVMVLAQGLAIVGQMVNNNGKYFDSNTKYDSVIETMMAEEFSELSSLSSLARPRRVNLDLSSIGSL